MSISPDQESSLRISANKIETTIKQLEKNYAVQDKQDVLAMCSLQFAAQVEKSRNHKSLQNNESEEKIQELIDIIDIHMAAY